MSSPGHACKPLCRVPDQSLVIRHLSFGFGECKFRFERTAHGVEVGLRSILERIDIPKGFAVVVTLNMAPPSRAKPTRHCLLSFLGW